MSLLQKLRRSAILGFLVWVNCAPSPNAIQELCHLHVAFLTRQFRQVGSRLDDVPAGWSRSSACCSLRGWSDIQANEQQRQKEVGVLLPQPMGR